MVLFSNNQGCLQNGGTLSCMSGFFIIIGGFILRLTKLLLKVVLVLFCGKSSIYQFKRGLLSMLEFSTHQSLKETPFVNVPILPLFCFLLLMICAILRNEPEQQIWKIRQKQDRADRPMACPGGRSFKVSVPRAERCLQASVTTAALQAQNARTSSGL